MIYFGISLNMSDLVGSVYINQIVSSLMEVPTLFLIVFLVGKVGRRKPVSAVYLTASIGSLISIPFALSTSKSNMSKIILYLE